jgi:hypothetical protein
MAPTKQARHKASICMNALVCIEFVCRLLYDGAWRAVRGYDRPNRYLARGQGDAGQMCLGLLDGFVDMIFRAAAVVVMVLMATAVICKCFITESA